MTQVGRFTLSSLRTMAPLAILALGVGGFLVFGQKAKPPEQAEPPEKIPLVQTVAVAAHTTGFPIEVDGTIVPYREIKLAAEVAGKITKREKDAKPGYYVTDKAFLAEIDPRDYQAEVDRLTQEQNKRQQAIEELDVEIENTQALITIAEKDLVVRKDELTRMKDLYQRGGLSQTDLEKTYRNALTAENTKQTLDNQLKLARKRKAGLEIDKALTAVQLKRAQYDKDRTTINSPIDGVIIREMVQKGDYVQKGQELFTIEDTSKVEVQTSLRMEEMQWIWDSATESSKPTNAYQLPELPATVTYTLGGRSTSWSAKLSRYDGLGLDEKTRMVPVRLVVPKPREPIVPEGDETSPMLRGAPPALVRGMFVTVEIPLAPKDELLSFPEKAIRPGNRVWLERDGKLAIVPIRVAKILPGKVLVLAKTSAIHKDDNVIVSPLPIVKEGMKVRKN